MEADKDFTLDMLKYESGSFGALKEYFEER